jgi:hypothetical protein
MKNTEFKLTNRDFTQLPGVQNCLTPQFVHTLYMNAIWTHPLE